MNDQTNIRNRIQSLYEGEDPAKLAQEEFDYIRLDGFAKDKEIRLQEEGLWILAYACQRIGHDEEIRTFRFN